MINRNILLREGFDYTEWRQENLPDNMTLEEISKAAMEYDRKLDAEKKDSNKPNTK